MLVKKILKHVSNIPGWTTNRRIIVFESDDWGSIRMPSIEVARELNNQGLDFFSGDGKRYNQLDTLESYDDFEQLFELLSKHKDINERSLPITALTLVANPDFDKIKESRFEQYHYELLPATLERYQGNTKTWNMWLHGIKSGILHPEFHGREHLNICTWMRDLKSGNKQALAAFDKRCWGFKNVNEFNVKYQAAFDLENAADIKLQADVVKDGLHQFVQVFGKQAKFFVPPNGPLNNKLEDIAAVAGIEYISTPKKHIEPLGEGKTKKHVRFLGDKNSNGQIYITRNAFFEPSYVGVDWVKSCLSDIDTAFFWNKPAVISSHRVNYIGGLNEQNIKKSLTQLDALLSNIKSKWPSVEFMTSTELGQLIRADKMKNKNNEI